MKTHLDLVSFRRSPSVSAFLSLVILAAAACAAPATAIGAEPPIVMERNHAGPYKALADLTYSFFSKDDLPNAALHARILEIVWDRAENDYKKKSAANWTKVDESMDAFIGPILAYARKAPDSAAVKTAYATFVENLKLLNKE